MLHQALTFYRRHLKRRAYGWFGDYSSWQQAEQDGTGYDSDRILKQVIASALKVKNGLEAYERDSVIFDRVLYSWPLLSALLWAAARNAGRLNVIDFGGSLGTSYFQNRRYLDPLSQVSWNIVEQEQFVRAGREHMQDERLRFYFNIDECVQDQGAPNIIVVACVLQYLQDPYSLIERLVSADAPYILIDNMPFNWVDRDRITLQKVPPSIYPASYPCWFLDYSKVQASFGPRYEVVSEHHNDDRIELDGQYVPYRGFLLERRG